MRRREPPPLATWMLTHLAGRDRDEALHGDLLEEFHSGRNKSWFWRQAIAATLVRLVLSIVRRRVAFIFAILWSLLSDSWYVVLIQIDRRSDFAGSIWRMPWPWSTFCDFGWTWLRGLIFVWIGAFAYITLLALLRKRTDMRLLARGICFSIVVYCTASACWIAIVTGMLPRPAFHFADVHRLTWWHAIENMTVFGIGPCIPNILAILCVLWGTEAGSRRPAGLVR